MKIRLMIVLGMAVLALTLVLTTRTPVASSSTGNTVSGAVAFAAEPSPTERHPHIRAALHELREAREELKTAAHDFGGHRVEALEATDKAIRQLEECLKYDKD